jgi:hypothetical protein
MQLTVTQLLVFLVELEVVVQVLQELVTTLQPELAGP